MPFREPQQAQQQFQAQYQQLQHVGQHVTCLIYNGGQLADTYLPAFLTALPALSQLSLDHVRQLPAAAMAALPQLTRLTSLKLALDDDEQAASALAQLTHLRELQLCCDELQGKLLNAILQLAGLTELWLCTDTLPPLRQLARLSQLHKLVIHTADFDTVELELPEIARLSAVLEDFFVSTTGGKLKASCRCRCSCLPLCPLSTAADGIASSIER